MRPEGSETLSGLIHNALLYFVLGGLLMTIFLRLAAKWADNLVLPFGKTFVTVSIASFLFLVLRIPIGMLLFAFGLSELPILASMTLMLPIWYLIQVWIVNLRHQVSFGKAAKLTGLALLPATPFAVVDALVVLTAMGP